MSPYTDYDVKSRAMTRFLLLVSAKNKSLGARLTKRRDAIYAKTIANIQQIGVTAYAQQVLDRRTKKREELENE